MQNPATGLANYLGVGELSFDLEPSQRRWLMVVSVLPAVLIIGLFTQVGYEIDGTPETGSGLRLYRLATVVQAPAAFVGLGVMVFAGIGRVSRPQASFCLLGAMTFAALAFVAFIFGSSTITLVDDGRALMTDWHAFAALQFANAGGLVAAGYGFLAFRGLAPDGGGD
jgi:hypothetical protein